MLSVPFEFCSPCHMLCELKWDQIPVAQQGVLNK